MSAIVAIGEPALVGGYALAGVRVLSCADAREARAAFAALPADTGLLLLTPMAEAALEGQLSGRALPRAVIPA